MGYLRAVMALCALAFTLSIVISVNIQLYKDNEMFRETYDELLSQAEAEINTALEGVMTWYQQDKENNPFSDNKQNQDLTNQ